LVDTSRVRNSRRSPHARSDAAVPFPNPSCRDIGGSALLVEVLEGAEYRQAFYWCLEAPLGTEHETVARALEIIDGFLGTTQ
jgi:hypothetical protein